MTALAFVLIIGKAERFGSGKQIASYLGLVPLEESSGHRLTTLPDARVPADFLLKEKKAPGRGAFV